MGLIPGRRVKTKEELHEEALKGKQEKRARQRAKENTKKRAAIERYRVNKKVASRIQRSGRRGKTIDAARDLCRLLYRKSGFNRCSVIGCKNIPGTDGFPIQADHVVRVTDRPDLACDQRNIKPTCGCHNLLDFDEAGAHTGALQRLDQILVMWGPETYAYALEAMNALIKRPIHQLPLPRERGSDSEASDSEAQDSDDNYSEEPL